MKLRPGLLIGSAAVAAVAYTLIKKKNAVEQLSWIVKGVNINHALTNFTNLALDVTIRISNPTSEPLTFDRFNASLSTGGSIFAQLNANRSTNPITISPGITDIKTTANISTFSSISLVSSIIRQIINKTFSKNIRLTGTLYAAGFTIPVTQDIAIGFNNPSVAGIGKARVSLEFENNDEVAEYFKKSNIYVTTGRGKGFSLNGVKPQ